MSHLKLKASEHSVKSVTVFQSSEAEVVRTFSLDLKTGQNTVEISQLSSSIDPDSIRVSGLGDAARTVDILCRVKPSRAGQQSDVFQTATMRLLMTQKQTLEDEKQTRQQGLDLLAGYAGTVSSTHFTPADAIAFLDLYMEARHVGVATIRQLEEQIAELERAIQDDPGSSPKKGEANGLMTIVIVALNDCAIDLTLTYLVKHASWEPRYELHATTADGKPASTISLYYRARITQSTGEDWNNTALRLSLGASPALTRHSSGIPTLRPRKIKANLGLFGPGTIDPLQPQSASLPPGPRFGPATIRADVGSLFPSSNSTNATAGPSDRFVTTTPTSNLNQPDASAVPEVRYAGDGSHSGTIPELRVSAEGTTTVLYETVPPETRSMEAEGAVSIPSDGETHSAFIVLLVLDAEFTWVCVPRARSAAFVECQVTNTSSYRLLPGPVGVCVDEELVAKTQMQDVSVGGRFACSLGVDDALHVSHKRTTHTAQTPPPANIFAQRMKTTTCTTHTVVENRHGFDIPMLLVRDALPLADSSGSGIEVTLKSIGDVPSADVPFLQQAAQGTSGDQSQAGAGLGKNVRWVPNPDGSTGEKQGIFEWVCTVAAGRTVTLAAEWEVKSPLNVSWEETVQE